MLDDSEIINEFVEESTRQLSNVENQLLEIESSGANIDLELVNTVFRAVHSVKGTAGFLGLEKIQQLAHNLEAVMNLIRNRELIPTPTNVGVLLSASDLLRTLIENTMESNNADISTQVELLLAIVEGEKAIEQATSKENPEVLAEVTLQNISDIQFDTEPPEPAEKTPEPPKVPEAKVSQPPQKAPSESKESKQSDTSVRVPVGTLDLLMNLASELVLKRNSLIQFSSAQRDPNLDTLTAGIDQVTSRLQEAIMLTRMQPIGNVFSRFPRVVRDLCVKLNKKCDIEITGKTVEVDKSILEAIVDPLIHIVRNGIDHGIESPAERQDAGKTAPAKLEISAYHQAGRVRIDIKDNGKGIDPNRLRDKAVEKGIISRADANTMPDREAVRLIFHPGLSTAEKVTDVSGRGVGMDVVKSNIQQLGVTVEIDSEVGVGTTIHIILPLTLAIIPSLIVIQGEQRYAIPQVNILELVRINSGEFHKRLGMVNRSPVLRLRGELLPLIHLGDSLENNERPVLDEILTSSTNQSHKNPIEPKVNLNIAVVDTGTCRFAIAVDMLCDSEEIVVKPLGKHLKNCSSLDGATILGDGSIAWILDLNGLADKCNMQTLQNEATRQSYNQTNQLSSTERFKLLLFSNIQSDLFAVPLEIVKRIDRVKLSDVASVGGQEIIRQNGRKIPLLSIEHAIDAAPYERNPALNVIIFSVHGVDVGLPVNFIHDIVATNDVDSRTLKNDLVIGSILHKNCPVRLIDIHQMTRRRNPDWFDNHNEPHPEKTILVVEDSDFFRHQVCKALNEAGYTVFEAEDGKLAQDILSQMGDRFDLIITDIEMPGMTGFELCSWIRGNESTRDVPVIALTSLGGIDNLQTAEDAGVTSYLTKFNHDDLLQALTALLGDEKDSLLRRKLHSELVGAV
ncbi:MAG: response regulator [Pirellulaceae bacterium]